jgi:RHS repeat-associated protein
MNNDGLHFYLNDPLGTRRAQTDYAGVLEQTCASLLFGDALNCTNSLQFPTEHHFTGKERDAESGNDYFGARYFASTMGRWMSPDWSAKTEPVPYAKLDNPQSLNLYGYVGNNPLRYADADGHEVDLNGTDKEKAEEQRRLAANAANKDKNGVSESSLFKETTDKNGKTTLSVDKDAAASYDGKHSQGYKDLVSTINNKDVVSVNLVSGDNNNTQMDGPGTLL